MPPSIPQADLHTPEELLESADELLATGNPKMRRAAALEAIVALEAYVQATVFPSLAKKIGMDFSKWLEEKTRMDFDSRLSVITPIAIGLPVDTKTGLWSDYKKARKIRHSIIHEGRKVSQDEARFVVETVHKWIAYLGSTVELELALLKLKRYVESNHISVNTKSEALSLITDYFGKTKAATGGIEPEASFSSGNSRLREDLILKLGSHRIVIETKFSRRLSTRRTVHKGIEQILSFSKAFGATQAALIVFQPGEIEAGFEGVQKLDDGNLYVVVIKV